MAKDKSNKHQDFFDVEERLLNIKRQLEEAKKKLDETMGIDVNMDANSIVIYKDKSDGK